MSKSIRDIYARRGKRGEVERFDFSGAEAKKEIDQYIDTIKATKADLDADKAASAEYADRAEKAASSVEQSASSAEENAADAISAAKNAKKSAEDAAKVKTSVDISVGDATSAAEESRKIKEEIAASVKTAADSATAAGKSAEAAANSASEASESEQNTKQNEALLDEKVSAAANSASESAKSADAASGSKAEAKKSASAAAKSAESASVSEENASTYAQNAGEHASAASESKKAAADSALTASEAQSAASEAEKNAANSEKAAAESEKNAAASESAAAKSAEAAAASADKLVIDDALSGTSTNAIQNKVVSDSITEIKEDLDNLQNDKSFGENLYNKTKNINGVYINSSGVTTESETLFCTEMISIIPNQNYCFSMVTGLGGYFCISQYDNDRKFIKNDNIKPEAFTIATDAKRKYIIKQYDCAYIVVSSVIAYYADNLMIAKGSDYIYKDYLWYWNDDTRKQVKEVKEFLDNQKVVDLKEYTLPYIKNGKLCCNGSGKTAYYAGIDCGSKINAMWCNFIFEEEKENLGNATLIINPNGVDSISNITDISLHCQIFPDRVKMDILGAKFGQDKYYYKTLLEFNFDTPLVCDGITEHTAILSVSESSNNVYLTIDGTQYSSHFTPDDNIPSISDVIGQYVIIEHFCTTERAKTTMPMFTYLQARDINNIYKLRDYFDRQNGILQNAPTGQVYHLLNNEKYKR